VIRKLVIRFGLFFLKILFKLRYKIVYKGLDRVHTALTQKKGIVFLPNHPTIFLDPLIISFSIMSKYDIRPLVTEYMYYDPLFYPIMRLIRALSVPDFSTGVNPLKFARLQDTLKEVEKGLRDDQAFLIFPSGMTKAGPREILGGTFAVHQLLSAQPDVHVVLVRITGLWGSRFSRAYTKGRQVNGRKVFKESLKDLLKAAVFFLPRRKVEILFEVAPANLPRKGTTNEINRFLEEWYNKPFELNPTRGEPLAFVPYSLFGEQEPQIEEEEQISIDDKQIPKELQKEIVEKIAEISNFSVDHIKPTSYLIADLSLDSLSMAELVTFLETRYDLKRIDPESLSTVAHTFLAATHQLETAEIPEFEWNKKKWEKPRKKERVFLGNGVTLPDVFLSKCDRSLFEIAAADPLVGPVTYYFLKSRVLLLANQLAKLPGKRLGILLPASITTTLLILSAQMAGKIPVMINWTVGGRHLESVLETSKIEVALTSWSFLNRLENVDLSPLHHILVILEEFKATFSWWQILTTPFKAFIPTSWLKRFGCLGKLTALQPFDEAVVLFTSGTESTPKGVPLSHLNLLSNMRATLSTVEFYSTDTLLSSLPPFHSFGFTVTGLLPLLAGARVVYYPNPTDSGAQARTIRAWNVTIVCSAPSFMINILRQGIREPFTHIRTVVTGAEHAPDALFSLAHTVTPNAVIWEGYGITECSPVLTINTSNDPRMGVGKPLPGIQIHIVHPEDYDQEILTGESGMILAAGPNIFSGYLQKDLRSPFHKTWYVTGDIGYLNPDGALIITGRLKRFVKIGGEMISLTAIESSLNEEYPHEDGPQLAVCPQGEEEGRPRLILFSTHDLQVMDINTLLHKKGFSNLIRIDEVVHLDEIPLLGTGKVAYRQLEQLLL